MPSIFICLFVYHLLSGLADLLPSEVWVSMLIMVKDTEIIICFCKLQKNFLVEVLLHRSMTDTRKDDNAVETAGSFGINPD